MARNPLNGWTKAAGLTVMLAGILVAVATSHTTNKNRIEAHSDRMAGITNIATDHENRMRLLEQCMYTSAVTDQNLLKTLDKIEARLTSIESKMNE